MLGWDRYGFHKNCARTHYVELLILHPVESARHVVDSGESGARNVDALFSCSGGTGTDLTKSASGDVEPNLCFFASRGICG
jgi:hypothetical protein